LRQIQSRNVIRARILVIDDQSLCTKTGAPFSAGQDIPCRGAARLAGKLDLPASEVDLIVRAAPLHGVGKFGVPDSILLRRAPPYRSAVPLDMTLA
jgi:hypothetical protein